MTTKAQRMKTWENKIVPALEIFCVELIEYNTCCFRLRSEKITIDYFPKSFKLFKHKTQTWLKVQNEENPLKEILVALNLK